MLLFCHTLDVNYKKKKKYLCEIIVTWATGLLRLKTNLNAEKRAVTKAHLCELCTHLS